MPELNFTLNVWQRIKFYESVAVAYERMAKQAADENSYRAWMQKAAEHREMAQRLRGA